MSHPLDGAILPGFLSIVGHDDGTHTSNLERPEGIPEPDPDDAEGLMKSFVTGLPHSEEDGVTQFLDDLRYRLDLTGERLVGLEMRAWVQRSE